MRLANSAAFPSLMPATTLDLAIARLGTQGLFNALIEFAAREALEGDQPRIRDLMRRIWPHALGTAVMAADLRQRLGKRDAGDAVAQAYLAGLMSSVGKPIVGHLLLESERQMERAGQRRALPEPVLQSVMDSAHGGAGASVCRNWELPAEVIEAVQRQTAWNAADPTALSNLVRFAAAWTARVGLTVGNCNGPEVDRTFGEGRALLRLDEATVKHLSYGFKERVTVLSNLRG
jgi:HD-like signal output (HDOD) protein